jgi:hypothetical protein
MKNPYLHEPDEIEPILEEDLAVMPIDDLKRTLGLLVHIPGEHLSELLQKNRQYSVYCLMIADCLYEGMNYNQAIAHALEASKPEHYPKYIQQNKSKH